MTKVEFICILNEKLSGLPQDEIEERLSFYGEMIDDRMDEGFSEEDAVRDVGNVDDIAAQIIEDVPFLKIVKNNIKRKKRKLGAGEIILLVLGAPLWLSLLIAALAVLIALYAVLWSIIVSLWSVFAALAGCALGGVLSVIPLAFVGNAPTLVAMIGAALVCAGLSIFTFFGCKLATKGLLILTKKMAIGIKNLFIRKENA